LAINNDELENRESLREKAYFEYLGRLKTSVRTPWLRGEGIGTTSLGNNTVFFG
jgi:hypothetical protein